MLQSVNDEDRRRDRPDLRRQAQGLRDHQLVHRRDRRRRGRREADRDDDDDADSLSKPMPIRQWLLPVMCVSFPYVIPCLKHRRYRLLKEDTRLILREILADFDAIGGEIQRCRR